MKKTARFLMASALSGTLIACAPALLAQSGSGSSAQQKPSSQGKPSPAQPQNQNQAQSQNQTQSQNQDPNQASQYTGVSNPPPNSTIVANEPYSDASLPAQTPPPQAQTPLPPPQPAPAASAAPSASQNFAASAPPPSAAPDQTASASSGYDNTDYGIVTSAPSQNQTAAPSDPSLQKRPWNPADHIVNSVPVNPNELAPGANITVHLSQPLSSDTAVRGAIFHATVAYNVYNGPMLIIPAGSQMRGIVTDVAQGHRVGLHARLRLSPQVVILPDGTAYHIDASAVQAEVPGTRTNNEGTIIATLRLAKDGVTYGAGAGTGAVVGAVVGGPVGAGVGSLVGAGVATTHLLMQDPSAVNLPKGATLIFSLNQPLLIVPTQN